MQAVWDGVGLGSGIPIPALTIFLLGCISLRLQISYHGKDSVVVAKGYWTYSASKVDGHAFCISPCACVSWKGLRGLWSWQEQWGYTGRSCSIASPHQTSLALLRLSRSPMRNILLSAQVLWSPSYLCNCSRTSPFSLAFCSTYQTASPS